MFDSVVDCMQALKYAKLRYGTLETGPCPDEHTLKNQYRSWMKKSHFHIPSDADLDPYNLPAWPEMNADVNSPGFVGSPEYIGMTTNQNVVNYANIGMKAKVDLTTKLRSFRMPHRAHGQGSNIQAIFDEFDRAWFD